MSPEKVCRSPRARANASPPSNPVRRRRASTVSPRWGALAPTAATSAGCVAPNRPSSSRVHRKREFGDSVPPRSRRRIVGFRTSGCGPSALGGRGRLAARRAQGWSRRQKPARASRRADADAAQIDAAGRRSTTRRICSSRGSPIGSVAANRRRRRADGPSPRASRVSSASQSLASNKASIAGLALTTKPGGKRIARRALSASHSPGASCGSKAAAACSRDNTVSSAADEGGEWVKVGAREWTSNRRRRMADDSGFIVSESLTRSSKLHHAVGASILAQG